jgi:hypothetical protein
VANAALYFAAVAARSNSFTSSTLSTAGIRRGCGTTVSRRAKSGRSSVTVKKKRRAETALLMLGGCMPIRVWCSWKRRRSSADAESGDRPMKAANDRT